MINAILIAALALLAVAVMSGLTIWFIVWIFKKMMGWK